MVYRVALVVVCTVIWSLGGAQPGLAQQEIDTLFNMPDGTSDMVFVSLPPGYNPVNPAYSPAIFVWWHQVLGNRREMWSPYTDFIARCNARGWILVSSEGPNDRHWNARPAQDHVQIILDWLTNRAPFSMDSIYFAGSSMGGSAGQIWHYNHCGPDDYMIAASVGTSGILDTERRQWEYLRSIPSDTNRSMRAAFGGIPCDDDSCDGPEFEYHRYSALYLADTTKSFHFNGMHLPVYQRWGAQQDERDRYGMIAESLAVMRRFFPAPTDLHESDLPGHGYINIYEDSVLSWLAQFSVNREPDTLSLAADEDDDYYWTHVSLPRAYTFGRYGVARNVTERQLDINLVRNVDTISIDLTHYELDALDDFLTGYWIQRDPQIDTTVVALYPLDYFYVNVLHPSGPIPPANYRFEGQTVFITLDQDSSYVIHFQSEAADENNRLALAESPQLVRAYPNPFNAQTTFVFESARQVSTTLEIYSLLGEQVRTIPVLLKAGRSSISFDAAELASGIYFATLLGAPGAPLKLTLLK
jgi:hypothetical protein